MKECHFCLWPFPLIALVSHVYLLLWGFFNLAWGKFSRNLAYFNWAQRVAIHGTAPICDKSGVSLLSLWGGKFQRNSSMLCCKDRSKECRLARLSCKVRGNKAAVIYLPGRLGVWESLRSSHTEAMGRKRPKSNARLSCPRVLLVVFTWTQTHHQVVLSSFPHTNGSQCK